MEGATASPPKGPSLPACDWVEIGEVRRPQGLKGTLLVSLHGDDPGNLIRSERVQLSGDPGAIEFQVLGAKAAGMSGGRARVRVQLAALDSVERASRWVGARISIPETAVQPLPPGEYYWREILGLRCRTLDGRELGTVEEIRPTPTNDLLVVRGDTQTVLVPTLRGVIQRVDRERGEVWIDPPEGLLEGGA